MHGIEIDEKVFQYSSLSSSQGTSNESPQLLILGGIHGNEPCGTYAIDRFIEELEAGLWHLKQGSITLAYGNLEAIKGKTRYIDYNMNRMFGLPHIATDSIEYNRVRLLEKQFPQQTAILDLHSALSPALDFMLAETPAHHLAHALQPSYLISGWENFASVTGDTECYGLSMGIPAVTYEAGQHDDEQTLENAYQMLLRFLNHYSVIEYQWSHPRKTQHLILEQVITKQTSHDRWLIPISNFMTVKQDQAIIHINGNIIRSPFDAHLVFPVPTIHCKVGEEITFLARLSSEK